MRGSDALEESTTGGARGNGCGDMFRISLGAAQFSYPASKWNDPFGSALERAYCRLFGGVGAAFNQVRTGFLRRGVDIGAKDIIQFFDLRKNGIAALIDRQDVWLLLRLLQDLGYFGPDDIQIA